MKLWGHLKTVSLHRRLVRQYCFRAGLYRQGLLHDLSKYSPAEFFPGVKYYSGKLSPHSGERKDKGYSAAWLHHKGRNKHHPEYWMDYGPDGGGYCGGKMPVKYVVEMFCDRLAACRVYHGADYKPSDAYDYFVKSRERCPFHPETAELLEALLVKAMNEGEEAAFRYIRNELLNNQKGMT